MLVEYPSRWKYNTFTVEGYETEDLHKIDSTSGTQLELLSDENCLNTCKDYIVKNNDGIKKVLFRVPKQHNRKYYNFQIRYGEQEYYYGKNIFSSLMFGFCLSLPNIIIEIIRKIKGRKTADLFTISLNMLLHFAYGFKIGRYIHIGGDNCLVIGNWLIGIFIILFLASIFLSFVFDDHYPIPMVEVLYNFFKKLEELKTAREVFYYYKKLPPNISIDALGQHEESREVWSEYKDVNVVIVSYDNYASNDGKISSMRCVDFYDKEFVGEHFSKWGRTDKGGGKMVGSMEHKRKNCKISVEKRTEYDINKNVEYKYESWQDNTMVSDNIFKSYYPVLNVELEFEVQFDKEAKDCINKIKDEIRNEGKKLETNLKINEIFKCSDMPKKERCYIDESAIKKLKKKKSNIKYLIAWIIMVILGYSSIIEPYCIIGKEVGQISFRYIKFVSGTKNYRAGYMKNDEDFYEKNFAESDKGKNGKIMNDYDIEKDENDNMLELEKKLI